MYVQKITREGRSQDEVVRLICWLIGYNQAGLLRQVDLNVDFETFFAEAPAMHPNRVAINGMVCGVRMEAIEGSLVHKPRQLAKLIDELAKDKAMERILRS